MEVFSAKGFVLITTLLFLDHFLLLSSCHSLHKITPSQPLIGGDILLSDKATFALGFFNPSNNSRNRYVGIWFTKDLEQQTVVWVAKRENPLNDSSGVLSINAHGNIVLVLNGMHSNLKPLWSSNVSITSPNDTFVKLLDTGSLVLFENDVGRETVLWQSFDYPGDTMLLYMKLGLNRRTGFNLSLTSWRSPDDPRSGNVTHMIDPTGYPQRFTYKNGAPYWRGGPWTGLRFSGISHMSTNFIFNVSYVDNANEVFEMVGVQDPSVFLRIVVDNTGFLSRKNWQARENRWFEHWRDPIEDCDKYRWCGSNSICDPYNGDKFVCVCLPGFEPKNPQEWYARNGSGGCVKKNASTCQSGEGFVKVDHVKVPDTSKAHVDKSMMSRFIIFHEVKELRNVPKSSRRLSNKLKSVKECKNILEKSTQL